MSFKWSYHPDYIFSINVWLSCSKKKRLNKCSSPDRGSMCLIQRLWTFFKSPPPSHHWLIVHISLVVDNTTTIELLGNLSKSVNENIWRYELNNRLLKFLVVELWAGRWEENQCKMAIWSWTFEYIACG